jgi:putative ABC transport system substrate-binding protein
VRVPGLGEAMRRRDFITFFGGAMAWPRAVSAQQPEMPRIGFLGLAPASGSADRLKALRTGLGDLGIVEGKNIIFDFRWATGPGQLSEFAAELVKDHVTVIVTSGNAATLAAKSATSAIPIVFSVADDPVRLGLVASFSRPGGNVTGVSQIAGALGSKRLDLLHELVPRATLIGMLRNPNNPAEATERDEQAAAQATGQSIIVLNVASESDIDTAFATAVQKQADVILVNADATLTAHRDQIIALAARHRLPALYPWREYAEAGGLMSYGTSLNDGYHQMGVYVGKILRGVEPADLPVTQPTKIELVINLKTAKTLGLAISPKLLVLADAVVE